MPLFGRKSLRLAKVDEPARQGEAAAAVRSDEEPARKPKPEPIDELRPVVQDGVWGRTKALLSYLVKTEVHTYAFSVAANAILALFPFIVMILTVSRVAFHTTRIEPVVGDVMKSFLPTGQDFVMRNMQLLAHPRKGMQVFSVFMLLVSSTGVFLPLEVALNQVWGVRENRSYLHNQVVSLGLALAVGALALCSVTLSAAQRSVLSVLFWGHTENVVFEVISHGFLHLLAGVASVLLFFLIYWILPNRRLPAIAVLPTAIVIGLLWEGAKVLYVLALPWLDFQNVYGPFYISVGLMMWAFLSGLMLLAGAHFSATSYTLRLAREAVAEERSAGDEVSA